MIQDRTEEEKIVYGEKVKTIIQDKRYEFAHTNKGLLANVLLIHYDEFDCLQTYCLSIQGIEVPYLSGFGNSLMFMDLKVISVYKDKYLGLEENITLAYM